jgi:hypothetical protein
MVTGGVTLHCPSVHFLADHDNKQLRCNDPGIVFNRNATKRNPRTEAMVLRIDQHVEQTLCIMALRFRSMLKMPRLESFGAERAHKEASEVDFVSLLGLNFNYQ